MAGIIGTSNYLRILIRYVEKGGTPEFDLRSAEQLTELWSDGRRSVSYKEFVVTMHSLGWQTDDSDQQPVAGRTDQDLFTLFSSYSTMSGGDGTLDVSEMTALAEAILRAAGGAGENSIKSQSAIVSEACFAARIYRIEARQERMMSNQKQLIQTLQNIELATCGSISVTVPEETLGSGLLQPSDEPQDGGEGAFRPSAARAGAKASRMCFQ